MSKPLWMIGRSAKGAKYLSKSCPICKKWKYDYTIYDDREICIQCANQLEKNGIKFSDKKLVNKLIDEILALAKIYKVRTRLKRV